MEKYKLYLRHIIPFVIMTLSVVISVFTMYNNPALIYEYDEALEGFIVSDARGNISEYTIPDNINEIPVVGIGVRAFFQHSDLEEVKFENPENIKLIDRLAFSECPKLKTIDLRYVEKIGKNAFAYDSELNNLEIGAKHILGSAFFMCEALDTITLKEGVISIGTFAFSHTKREELKIPYSMKTIYNDAFKYMNLKTLYIPYGFTSGNITYLNPIIKRY